MDHVENSRENGRVTLALKGRWVAANIADIQAELTAVELSGCAALRVDARQADLLDLAGAWALNDFLGGLEGRALAVTFEGAPPDALRVVRHALADGDIVARTEIGEVLVAANGRNEMVHFLRTFVFRDDVTPRTRLLLANRLNAKGLVARYYIGIETDLAVECDIVCATGLDPAQLLATLRLFTTHVERLLTSGRTRRYFA